MTSASIIIPAEMRAGFDTCREITRRNARNFYYGLRLTPEPRRSALYAIYAWSRKGDDITDSDTPTSERIEQLDAFAEHTRGVIADPSAARDPFWKALAFTVNAYPIEPVWLDQMLEGFRTDLAFSQPADSVELELYCDRVAGTVGRMCVAVWGLRNARDHDDAMRLATERGLAFQMTNILRDFGADFDEGRIYIDRMNFEEAGLTADGLRAWSDPAACDAFVREIGGRSMRTYERAAELEALIQRDCVPVLRAMTEIYAAVLDRVAARPHRIVEPGGARVGAVTKAGIAARAMLLGRRARRSGV